MVLQLLGDEPALLWVFEDNPRARRFYEKLGFTSDGTRKDIGEEDNDDELRGIYEIRMVRGKSE